MKYLEEFNKEHEAIMAEEAKREAEKLLREKKEREERAQELRIAEINRQKRQETPVAQEQHGYLIDCHACKLVGGMKPAQTRRFSGMVVVSGTIIVIPSVLGMMAAVLMVFLPFGLNQIFLYRLAAAIGLFCFSCVMGTVGWVLLSTRNVFLCKRCGYILERAQD